jgi:SAM-dependent methyltransferase
LDRQVPGIVERYGVEPSSVLDIGCGNGKTLIWLAKRGFEATGIDLAPTALREARELAGAAGVECRWLRGVFPEDFDDAALQPESFGFVMERGCLQHALGDEAEIDRFLGRAARLLSRYGLFYSLIAADEGRQRFYGPHWSRRKVREAFSRHFSIRELELSVFTLGEPGSMGAWRVVAAAL